MTSAEIREAVVLTAISASNLISGIEDSLERHALATLFQTTFERERELAERNARFVLWATAVSANGDQLVGEAGNT